MGVEVTPPPISYGYQYPVRALKVGMILLFNLAIARIPDHWALCDGSLGTPDLRNRFIPCAGDTYDPGDTGGAINHTHTFTSDVHYHGIGEGEEISDGTNFRIPTTSEVITGTTNNGDVRPPYHGIVFIKKIEEGGP